MPNNTNITRKARPFNLIKQKVEIKESVKVVKDWYILFNILIVCLVVVLSGVSFLGKTYMATNLKNRKTALATKINNRLNTGSKEIIRSQIAILSDKYQIYQDFLNQNFNVNDFYTSVLEIYPGVSVEKFSVQPSSNTIDIDISFDSEGYTDFPKFVSALENNAKFRNTLVKNISFYLKKNDADSENKSLIDEKDNPENYITKVSLSVNRADLVAETYVEE